LTQVAGNLVCCQRLGAETAVSPFQRVTALDYYDGPVEGLLACAVCEREHHFRLIAWDSEGESRLYALSRLPAGSLDVVEAVLDRFGPPSRPLWVPVVRFETAEEEAAAHQVVDAVLASAEPADLLVLTRGLVSGVDRAFRLDPDRVRELRARLGDRPVDLGRPELGFLGLSAPDGSADA
jgi:hypothetical protein